MDALINLTRTSLGNFLAILGAHGTLAPIPQYGSRPVHLTFRADGATHADFLVAALCRDLNTAGHTPAHAARDRNGVYLRPHTWQDMASLDVSAEDPHLYTLSLPGTDDLTWLIDSVTGVGDYDRTWNGTLKLAITIGDAQTRDRDRASLFNELRDETNAWFDTSILTAREHTA